MHKDITATSHLDSHCIYEENGLFNVQNFSLGASLHVQNKLWCENQHVFCECTESLVKMELVWRTGLKAT